MKRIPWIILACIACAAYAQAAPDQSQDRFLEILSKDKSLCDAYKRYIENEVTATEHHVHYSSPMCQRTFGKEFPEFTSVKWLDIKPDDYPQLAVQAYRYINFWPWSNPGMAPFLTDSQIKVQLNTIKLNYSNNWWHMWLGKADIGNNGHLETLLRVEYGRCGEPSMTGRPPTWGVPVMVVDGTGKGIDTVKSEWILGVSVLPPISINKTVGIHGLDLTAYDVFEYSKEVYFDRWEDQWTNHHYEPFDPRYSKLTIYMASHSKTTAICSFKFRK